MRTRLKSLWNSRHPLARVARDTSNTLGEIGFLNVGSSLAYATILSIVPLLAVSLTVYQFFEGPRMFGASLEPMILKYLAEGAGQLAIETLTTSLANARSGMVGATGFGALLVTAIILLSSAESAINRAWRCKKKRSWPKRIGIYLALIALGPLGLAIAFSALEKVPSLPFGAWGMLLSIPVSTLIHKLAPNRPVLWRAAWSGGLFTSIVWALGYIGFRIYTREFVNYDKIYGSLGSIPLLLLWIYLNWVTLLAGAAFSASVQKLTEEHLTPERKKT